MKNEFENIQYSPIDDYKYSQWFQEVQYNGKTLTDPERKEFIAIMDEIISDYSEGLPMMQNILNNGIILPEEYYRILRIVVSVMLFTYQTMIDSMVAGKYFIMADKDYERRFMRGKLMVILNEGFKRLYGFDKTTHKKSEWDRLLPLMRHFPEVINLQYQELTYHLEKHAQSSSWWKEERNLETHMDAEKLTILVKKKSLKARL